MDVLVGHVKAEVLHPSLADEFRMTGKGGDGARWGWMRFGAVFEGKEGIAEMKVAGWGEESAERFLSAQADPFTGVKGKKKSACSVRNDEQVGRAVMSGLKPRPLKNERCRPKGTALHKPRTGTMYRAPTGRAAGAKKHQGPPCAREDIRGSGDTVPSTL